MKIIFTGGGTGGHFYPIIAVVQEVNKLMDEQNIVDAKLYFFSDSPFDKEVLFENRLIFQKIEAGKLRLYFSFRNFFDIFKVIFGIIQALVKVFNIYPDVIFSKGGYSSFPTVIAGKILNIPIIMHESDTNPGRVNIFTGKFAKKIAISFKEAGAFFPYNKTAWTGHPLRHEISMRGDHEKGLEHFKLESNLKTILVIGGSQGAELINNVLLDALPDLLEKYQIIHQTGIKNLNNTTNRAKVILENNLNKNRYLPLPFLNSLQLKMATGAADMIISRAGSTIFEIASWNLPSIIIPITNSNGDHQRKNAFAYAYAGACSVIEEMNMTKNVLIEEVNRIIEDRNLYLKMSHATSQFAKKDAGEKIAKELVSIALSHEK